MEEIRKQLCMLFREKEDVTKLCDLSEFSIETLLDIESEIKLVKRQLIDYQYFKEQL